MTNGSATRGEGRGGARRRRAALGLFVLMAAVTASAGADLRVKERISGAGGKPLGERTWTYADGKVRLDEGAAGLLLDAGEGVGWIWGFESERCEKLPVPGLGAGGGVAEITRAEKRGLDALFAAVGDAGVVITPRGESKTVAGVEAQRYDLVKNGEPVQERWHATGVEAEALDAIVQTVMQSEKLSVVLSVEEGQVAAQTVGFGYPVRVKDLRSGQVVEAVEIDRGAQPASAFTPPAACAGL